MSPISQNLPSPLAEKALAHIDELAGPGHGRAVPQAQQTNGAAPKEDVSSLAAQVSPSNEQWTEVEYVSKVGVLASSLPVYHNQFMKARRADLEKKRLQEHDHTSDSPDNETFSNLATQVGSPERSSEQQAEAARRLKPHSRSTIQLQSITANAGNPESIVLDMRSKSKHKTPRWQFGIRSRNEPVDAIKCLYKALESMGDCQWHINPPRQTATAARSADTKPHPVNVKGAIHLPSKGSGLSESPEKARKAQHFAPEASDSNEVEQTSESSDVTPTEPADELEYESEKDEDVDPNEIPEGYAPKDPWCIHVRWEKKGMSPPGATTTSSAQSSRVDLASNDGSNRRSSVLGSLSSAQGSAASIGTGDSSSLTNNNFNDTACFVYMDLQIYVLEADTYLVDFKSAGYETIIGERQARNREGKLVTEYIGSGNRKADKDVTSPQPFLDLANKLVIHLAKGAQ